MPFFRQVTVVVLLALTLVSCRRDPNVAKKQYLESGNKYMDRGRLKEAAIQYQNAVKIDPKYGPAYYKLGLLYLKSGNPGFALRNFHRAVELLETNQAYQEEYKDAMIQAADIDLIALYKDKAALDEVGGTLEEGGKPGTDGYIQKLLKKDPNSFDAFRLSGHLNFVKGLSEQQLTPSVAAASFDTAMEFYRKADALKPGDARVQTDMGNILLVQKHYAEAEPYFQKVIEKNKTLKPAYVDLYRLYMMEQKTGEAEQLLKQGIQNNPKDPEFLERLAYHYGALGRREDMLNVLGQIKAHAKEFQAVNQVVGDFYLRTGDAESALREYREGILNDASRKEMYQKREIEVLLRQGKRAEAAEVNKQILKENPKDPDAKSLRATFLLDGGDVNTALTELQSVVTTSPDNAVAHYQLGRAFLASRRADAREAAKQQFEQSINLQPRMVNPRLGLAQLEVMNGDFQAALDSVQEILKIDPGNVSAKLIQSQAYLGQKKYPESDSLITGMIKSNPSSPDVYYQAGLAALMQNKPQLAEEAFMRAYQLNPANSKSLLGVVDSEIQQGHPDKAMSLLESESKKAPNRLDIPLLMGNTAQREGKYQDSLIYFTKVLDGLDKKSKARADLYVQIAQTYRLQGNFDASIASLQKAREILPDNEVILADLGNLMDNAGHRTEARQAYEACLRINPNNALVLNNLAYLMAETGSDLDTALNYAQKAKGLQPNLGEISDTYGWILLKKGLTEQAIPVFKDLVSRAPASSTFHYHLGRAYAQKGDNKNATDELREALKHSPSKQEQQDIQDMLTKVGAK